MTGRPTAFARGLLSVFAVLPLFLLLCGASAPAQDVRATVSPTRVYVGDTVVYELQVSGAEDLGDPSGLELEDAEVRYLGSNQQSFTQIVNNRLTSTQTVSFRYALQPARSGPFEVESPTVTVNGKERRAAKVRFEVAEPEVQDRVVPVLRVTPAKVFLFQPFTVELRIFVHDLPGRGNDTRDPVSVQQRAPRVHIDWLEPQEAFEALGPKSASEWLGPKMASSRRGTPAGFSINDLERSIDPFDMFGSPFGSGIDRLAVFDLGGRPATAEDTEGLPALEGRASEYWVYTLTRQLRPLRTGRQDFGPASVRGVFAESATATGLEGRDVYAVSERANLEVEAAPAEGRPAEFTGGVGSFRIDVDAQPRSLHVGDPLTLTLRVKGEGNLAEIGPPRIEDDPRFQERFKVYEATSSTQDGERRFTWSLRPLAAGSVEVPPVVLAHFDFEREQYVTQRSSPISLEVQEASRLDPREIVGPTRGTPKESDLTANAEGLFAPLVDRSLLVQERVDLSRVLVLVAGLFAATPLLLFSLRWLGQRRSDPWTRHRRLAEQRARESITALRSAIGAGDREAAARHARATLAAWIGAALGTDEASATARDLETRLASAGLPDEGARTRELLERWESLQYGGAGVDLSALGEATDQRAEALRQALAKGGRR